MSSKNFRLSEEEAKILSVLKPDGLVIQDSNNRSIWVFWFDDFLAFDLSGQTFYNLCVWKDELAFAENFSLPTSILPLKEYLGKGVRDQVQERFLTHAAHSVLLDENKVPEKEVEDVF